MDIVIQIAEGDQVFRYATVSAITLVCYEFLITLDNEIRFVWNRRISFGGALLLLCRYLPFGSFVQAYVYMIKDNLDTTTCIAGVRASACFLLIEFLLSALVLYTRAYAVWEGSKRILYLLVLTYAGVLVAGAYSVYMFLRGIKSLLVIWPNGCVPLPVNDDLWIALAILIVSESLSLGLLLIKSVKHAHALKNFGIFHGNSKRRIISVMSHDGIGYFVCTLAITITNLVILCKTRQFRFAKFLVFNTRLDRGHSMQ
ncbi:hypothetical protein SCHPADRAFT_908261 [Schizopora paradoxa]|uniref:DUF6533 domain-containing protein n=1 Tax=Schizopora paradoxa TaxID=27342 RepID=A0A0H2RBR8_9AGAM|nr:hypothetical protein SCHPADRAFT_908261 [Schizopora paradoxa]